MIAHSSHVGTVALPHTIQEHKPVLLMGKPAPTVENSTTSTKSVGLPQPEPTDNTQLRLLLQQ